LVHDLVGAVNERLDPLSGRFDVRQMDLVGQQPPGLQDVDRSGRKGAFAAGGFDDCLYDSKSIANDLTAPDGQFERCLEIAEFNLLPTVSLAHSISICGAFRVS
jgi:hypothetical protein